MDRTPGRRWALVVSALPLVPPETRSVHNSLFRRVQFVDSGEAAQTRLYVRTFGSTFASSSSTSSSAITQRPLPLRSVPLENNLQLALEASGSGSVRAVLAPRSAYILPCR